MPGSEATVFEVADQALVKVDYAAPAKGFSQAPRHSVSLRRVRKYARSTSISSYIPLYIYSIT